MFQLVMAAALAAAAAANPGTAAVADQVTTARVVGSQLVITGALGRASQLRILDTTVYDVGSLQPGAGCVRLSATSVKCAAFTRILVSLGPRADSVIYTGSVPTVQDGGDGDDTLSGGDGADVLSGGPGNDVLNGRDGADDVSGGTGDDVLDEPATDGGSNVLSGGPGNDRIDGSQPNMRDRADFSDHVAGMTIDLGKGTATGPNELDEVANVQDVRGTAGDDTLIGDPWPNQLYGLGGDDTCVAGPGDLCVP
jgi:Ca2+-binding RTX toxin-like protein